MLRQSASSTSLSTARRLARGQSGAVLIEAAIVLPVLIMILIGIMEFGLLFTSYSKALGASRSGARVAASVYSRATNGSTSSTGPESATQTLALAQIVAAVEGDLKGLNNAVPVRMMIFRVASNGEPAGGVNGSCSDRCISYTWNSTSKKMIRDSTNKKWPNPQRCLINDYESIGVFVEIKHDFVTGVFGSNKFVSGRTSMRLEPGQTTLCS